MRQIGAQCLILSPRSSSASPALRRPLPIVSRAFPPISSILPSLRMRSSPVMSPTCSLTFPLASSILPLSSSLFCMIPPRRFTGNAAERVPLRMEDVRRQNGVNAPAGAARRRYLDIQCAPPVRAVLWRRGMIRNTWRAAARIGPLALVALCVIWLLKPAAGQAQGYGTQNGEWQTYGADLRSTRYSPLDQVSADNFNKL